MKAGLRPPEEPSARLGGRPVKCVMRQSHNGSSRHMATSPRKRNPMEEWRLKKTHRRTATSNDARRAETKKNKKKGRRQQMEMRLMKRDVRRLSAGFLGSSLKKKKRTLRNPSAEMINGWMDHRLTRFKCAITAV